MKPAQVPVEAVPISGRKATLSMLPPMSGMTWGGSVTVPGHVAQPNEHIDNVINTWLPTVSKPSGFLF